ncbi:MAG: hypothetical protein CM15mP74_17750 [Halieaceae bacterium]|nr:MAG: hypothetical protein CM15mP74_17750 [Halieaceae bacterium]
MKRTRRREGFIQGGGETFAVRLAAGRETDFCLNAFPEEDEGASMSWWPG